VSKFGSDAVVHGGKFGVGAFVSRSGPVRRISCSQIDYTDLVNPANSSELTSLDPDLVIVFSETNPLRIAYCAYCAVMPLPHIRMTLLIGVYSS